MSIRYRSQDGIETIVSGLTPGGDIEAGAVAFREGTVEFAATGSASYSDATVTFSDPMPDTDYVVTFIPAEGAYEFRVIPAIIAGSKTVTGFKCRCYNNDASTGRNYVIYHYTAFKLYTVQHAAQNAEDIANIKAVIPSTASSTNKLATSNELNTLATDTDSRLDDLEDLVPTGASVSNQLATKDNIDTVTTNANSRLKVVDIIPSTPVDGDVILYTGNEVGYRKGGIYQYAATPGAWVLISTADVDLSHYETSFTGTTAEWNALSSTEQNKYDLVSLTDDVESNRMREGVMTFSTTGQQYVYNSGNLKPMCRRDGDTVFVHMGLTGFAAGWNNENICTLPEGFRPDLRIGGHAFITTTSGSAKVGDMLINLWPDGRINLYAQNTWSGTNTFCYITLVFITKD